MMQYSNGVKPTSMVNRETVISGKDTSGIWFNGQSGMYPYKGKYYIIGDDVFLEYTDFDIAKQDWFGKSEEEMWDHVREEGELIESIDTAGKILYENYFLDGLFYRVHHLIYKTLECNTDAWEEILPTEELQMMELPSLPGSLASFMFPVLMDEVTEIYFDEELCYYLLDRGEIMKTLFSSAEEGEIPEVTYIVEFDKAYFKANPGEYSIEGRFSSVDEVLLCSEYASIGKYSYEEVDYVKVCLLDRDANDEEIDYIADSGLYWWMKMNTQFEGNYMPQQEVSDGCSYDIYKLLDGFFVLDANERSVLGKYSSFESAYNGAKDEYGDDDYEEDGYQEDDYDDEDDEYGDE